MPEELMKIVKNDDGTIGVFGPLGDKIFCWGLLVDAIFAVQGFNPEDVKKILPVGVLPFDPSKVKGRG